MKRMMFAHVVILTTTALAYAQPSKPAVSYTTIPLTLTPTAAPVPLGKVQLYPGYAELTPGNRVQGLLKVFMEQDNYFKLVNSPEWADELNLSLAEFKAKSKFREYGASGIAYGDRYTKMMGYLDRGARMKSIEWNEYFELRSDGFYLLLPEVQKMRTLAAALHMRLRNEIVTGEFHRATVSIQTFFGMAQALEQHPCLIGNLVSIAIVHMAIKSIEEMLEQPGCPNLFWALCDVPMPVVHQRIAVGGEKMFLLSSFEKYLTRERSLTDRELDAFLSEMNELLKIEDQRGGTAQIIKNARVRFALVVADVERIAKARTRLVAEGAKAEIVKEMPALQIAILDEAYRYEVLRDEFFKAYQLPYHQAAPWIAKTEEALVKAKTKGDIIGPALLPAVWKVKMAQGRIDQRMALLRAIEAIRLYAHQNGGKLPTSLAETGLPLAADPMTGGDLSYSVKDNVATLFGADTKQGELNNRKYEITIVK